MPVLVWAAALAVALSIPMLLFSLALDRAPGRQVSRNLNARMAPGPDLRELVLARSPVERIVQPLVRALAGPARRLSTAGMVVAIQRRLELSASSWPLERVLVLKVVLGGGLLAGGLAAGVGHVAAIGVALAGYLGPEVVLARMAAARQLVLSNQLPDTLDQLTICVEAGLGFDAALLRTSRSGHGPLSEEVTRLLQELRVGVPRAEALNNLLARTNVPELRQFVHAVVQAETYGVPISRVLRAQSGEQREKRQFRAEERAMQLPVKVIFPLVFCILPTIFIVVLGPAFIHLTTNLK